MLLKSLSLECQGFRKVLLGWFVHLFLAVFLL